MSARSQGGRPGRALSRAALAAVLVAAVGCATRPNRVVATPGSDDAPRPNIVLIVVDDLRPDVLGYAGHPTVRTPALDRLAAEGAWFENAFAVSPQCCPSRAAILTGTYGHVNGIRDNAVARRLHDRTFARYLRDSGYATAFFGKWHIGDTHEARPGFDHWTAFHGQGEYLDVVLNVDGAEVQTHGYSTDVLTDRAIEWIEDEPGDPFLLILSLKSVHLPLVPPARHETLYSADPVELPVSYHDPAEDLPAAVRSRFEERLERRDAEAADGQFRERIRNYWRMVPSVDESVARLIDALTRGKILDRTAVLFASDNGLLLGEHGITLKGRAYEPSIRIPLIVRYPPRVPPGSRYSASVLNIDLAPTILDLADVPVPGEIQGRSLEPLFDGSVEKLRSSWLYVHPYKDSPVAVGVRTDEWKYVFHRKGEVEEQLIDLVGDPDERENLAPDARYRTRLEEMRVELRDLLATLDAPPEWADPG